jgi:HEPN domain-containing protein
MSTKARSEEMLNRASRWLKAAEAELNFGDYDNTVYLAQMAAETAAKAILTALGIDYPKEHDISGIFLTLEKRNDLPKWFRDYVPKISYAIKILAEIRGLAAYGYERGLSLQDFEKKAPETVKEARMVFENAKRLYNEIFKS